MKCIIMSKPVRKITIITVPFLYTSSNDFYICTEFHEEVFKFLKLYSEHTFVTLSFIKQGSVISFAYHLGIVNI